MLLQAADVFRGADVGLWLCHGVVEPGLVGFGMPRDGRDIAPAALRLAESWCTQRGVRAGGAVQFRAYDGHRLPLADNSVDRVVCFDCISPCQGPGGHVERVGACGASGWAHRYVGARATPFSDAAVAKAEMAQFKVIENDVVMADIAAAAALAGLDAPQLLVYSQRPLVVPFGQYQRWGAANDLPKEDGNPLAERSASTFDRHAVFFLNKPGGGSRLDSRRPEALAADLRLTSGAGSSTCTECMGFAISHSKHGRSGLVG